MSFLQIRNLEKSFGATRILKDVSLEIEKGGFLVLVGPSGCGKSTLLNTIAGLEPITGGEIRIAGRNVAGLHPSKRDIAMVFQSYALYPNMTVAGNIAFGMEIRGVPKVEREAAITKVADMLQIGHLLDRKPSQLSGGQRQRVALARALYGNPRLVVLDEPNSSLDAEGEAALIEAIRRMHVERVTLVIVTHRSRLLSAVDRILLLREGAIERFGAPSEVLRAERPRGPEGQPAVIAGQIMPKG